MKKSGSPWTIAGSIVAGLTASLCCILPLLSLSMGFGSFAVSGFFAPWRPAFLTLAFVLVGAAWYFALRRRNVACDGEACVRRPGRARFVVLSIGTVLAATSAAFPWLARIEGGSVDRAPLAAGGETFTVSIPAMDCAACAKGIEATLRRTPGVLRAQVDYGAKRAEISFDPTKTKREALLARMDETGFAADRVTLK